MLCQFQVHSKVNQLYIYTHSFSDSFFLKIFKRFILNIYLLFINLFWLRQVLVAAHGIFVTACGIFSCSIQDLLLRYADSLVVACGIQFPDQGSNPGPLHWEHGILPTGPPGKSRRLLLDSPCFGQIKAMIQPLHRSFCL